MESSAMHRKSSRYKPDSLPGITSMSLKILLQDEDLFQLISSLNEQTTTAKPISVKACTTQCLSYVSDFTFQQISKTKLNIKPCQGSPNLERTRGKSNGM